MEANKSLQLHVRGIFKSKLALLDSKWYVHVIMKMENKYFVINFRDVYSEFETTVTRVMDIYKLVSHDVS